MTELTVPEGMADSVFDEMYGVDGLAHALENYATELIVWRMCDDYGDYLAQNLKSIGERAANSIEDEPSAAAAWKVFQWAEDASKPQQEEVIFDERRRMEQEGDCSSTQWVTTWSELLSTIFSRGSSSDSRFIAMPSVNAGATI